MASDRQLFKRARANWEMLRDAGSYSAPPEIGRVAIICSYHTPNVRIKHNYSETDRSTQPSVEPNPKEVRTFRKEAFALADKVVEEGREPEVVLNAQPLDIRSVLRDPSISDVITIGHGSLTILELLNIRHPDEAVDYEWTDAAGDANHLKTGYFIQRQCALLTYNLNVPLGMFVVTDARNVIAPVGSEFEPRGLFHPENHKLIPAVDVARPSYRYIKQALPYTDPVPPVNYDEVMR